MDNKLSELSKPVAYISRSVLNELQHGNRILGRIWRDGCESDSCAPIYSQEYVSALLARAERIDAMLTESVQALKAAEQRIAELEAKNSQLKKELHNEGAANAHAYERIRELEKRLEESRETTLLVRDAWQKDKERADAAEKRLATPVRLTDERTLWAGEDDYNTGHVKGWNANRIEQAALLKKQGFKVEGDE